MIYPNNDCTDFMILLAIVCVTYSSTILSLMIFNFSLFLRYHFCLLKIIGFYRFLLKI